MTVEGRALVVHGDNVDTDVMYPGSFLNIEDPDEMATVLFEGFDPTLRERLVAGTILVVGANFGIGSSREHVPLAMKGERDHRVVGRSFARIFYRNCVNLGLAIVACPLLRPQRTTARRGDRHGRSCRGRRRPVRRAGRARLCSSSVPPAASSAGPPPGSTTSKPATGRRRSSRRSGSCGTTARSRGPTRWSRAAASPR